MSIFLKSIKSYKALFSTCLISLFLYSTSVSFAENGVKDVIILLDRSASVKDYDPKLISRAWLMTFIKRLEWPYNFSFHGFDDRLHQYPNISVKSKIDVEIVMEMIQSFDAHGLTTDMEVPLRYLLNRNDLNSESFALIVSDGEPELWDEKRWYLSKKIRMDNRYEHLNKQYHAAKAQGLTGKQLYNRFKDDYHSRNSDLINERIVELKNSFRGKLVFLDLSGEYKFFKRWADAADAQYILAKAEEKKGPVEALEKAFISPKGMIRDLPKEQIQIEQEAITKAAPKKEIDKKTIPVPQQPEKIESAGDTKITEKVKPASLEPQTIKPPSTSESVEKNISVPPPLPSTKTPASTLKPSIAVKTYSKKSAPKKESKSRTIPLLAAIAITIGLISAIFLFYRKKTDPLTEKSKTIEDKPEENQYVKKVDKKIKEMALKSIKNTVNYIEKEIQSVVIEADKEQKNILEPNKNKFSFDKERLLRFPVPSGALIIHWTDKKGEGQKGPAIKISMHEILFEATNFDEEEIKSIECPDFGITLQVKRSKILGNNDGIVLARLDEFQYNIDDRIKWVEILTRLEDGINHPSVTNI